jgi:dTDP-4-dehydrorhamnose 3,5-epimerase
VDAKVLFPRLLESPLTFEDKRGNMKILYESSRAALKRSYSSKGVLRGLHHQFGLYTQEKVIRIISGKILDFVADPDDQNEIVWCKEIVPSDEWVHINSTLAHGFYALEDVVFEYFCDGQYFEESEHSYCIAEVVKKVLGITDILMSEKDKKGKKFGKHIQIN